MITEETFYRPPETGREVRQLPAPLYNLAHLLLAQSETGCVFVPIRSMQYMAVLDAEECIFVHREGRRMIELAWRNFRPGARTALTEAVAYDLVYYSPSGSATMARLQGEFYLALQALEKKQSPPPKPARILKLDVGNS
jgi:hypothetical protein